jgi:two-component system NarL family response regulator
MHLNSLFSPGGERHGDGMMGFFQYEMSQMVDPSESIRRSPPHHINQGDITMTIRIILADAHKVLTETLTCFLENEQGIKVVGVVTDGREVLELVASLRPDVVVMDIGMPGMNGIEVTRRLVTQHPKIKVVALSAFAHKHVLEMLEAGASAYIIKEDGVSELVLALHAVMKGQKYVCPKVAAAVVDNIRHYPVESVPHLGPREREVLQLLAEGSTSRAIGNRLFISPSTVDVHRRNIMEKLDLHTIAELTKYAVRNGLTAM